MDTLDLADGFTGALQQRIVIFLEAALPLWWADLEGLGRPELCRRAKLACWRFHGGDEADGMVGGEGLAAGKAGDGTQLNALAEMVACITLNEAAQPRPRPVRLFGAEWRYPGKPSPLPDVGAADQVGFEAFARQLEGS